MSSFHNPAVYDVTIDIVCIHLVHFRHGGGIKTFKGVIQTHAHGTRGDSFIKECWLATAVV